MALKLLSWILFRFALENVMYCLGSAVRKQHGCALNVGDSKQKRNDERSFDAHCRYDWASTLTAREKLQTLTTWRR